MLADGVQAAFAAGAVAELARAGGVWLRGAGAGLGAELAALAVLGEAERGAAAWQREGESGCPLLLSRVGAALAALGDHSDVTVLPDPWRLSGWCDDGPLVARLASVAAGLGERLVARGVRCTVAVTDLEWGVHRWVELAGVGDGEAARLLRAAAAFPGGWGPVGGEGSTLLAGGVEAAQDLAAVLAEGPGEWDVVCGFPVPAARRPGLSAALLEQVQRRGEMGSASLLARIQASPPVSIRLVAPGERLWREFARRDGADLGCEYPVPAERNAELVSLLVAFGAFAARTAAA